MYFLNKSKWRNVKSQGRQRKEKPGKQNAQLKVKNELSKVDKTPKEVSGEHKVAKPKPKSSRFLRVMESLKRLSKR
jgi:hypothetical protein